MVATQSGRLKELLDAASIVSEGCERDEEGAHVYYGSTSLLFLHQSVGGLLPDVYTGDLVFALTHDPHARLQVVRVAHREAWARASGALGPIRAEVRVVVTARGVMASVDVEAPVRRGRASGALF